MTMSYDNYAVGDAYTQLVHTASATGERVTLTMTSGVSVLVGHYNSAGSALYAAAILDERTPSTTLGPLSSGDKVYLHSALAEAKVVVGHLVL